MARGGARPGAGRPRTPVATLRLTGGFRPGRHGHRLATATAPVADLPAGGWQPAPEALAALDAAGQALVLAVLGACELTTVVEGAVLLEAGHAADALARWRAVDLEACSLMDRARAGREVRGWSALLAQLLAQLKVQP